MKAFTEIFNLLTAGDLIEEISDKTGLSEEHVELLIKGASPGSDTLCRIADAYGVTTDYLLGRTEEKEPAQAAAGQALEVSTINNIAQSEEVVKNFTDFLPILLEFAQRYFGEIEVQNIEAHNLADEKVYIHRSAEVTFVNSKGGKYCMILEEMEAEP